VKPVLRNLHRPARQRESDERLVRSAIDGDRQAFEQLVRRHQRGLVSHIFRMTGRRDGALDLAQEVFLKVYLSLPSFDPKYRFTTWLYRIASNCAIDQLRKKQPRTCSIHPDPDNEGLDEIDRTLPGSEPTPDDMLRYRELRGRVEAAILELPADYRQLILLRHRQFCRYDEIARITSLPLGTVKNRIFRAREMMKHQLADLLGAEAR
jgi:RNA polymerase sigma-70 factor (ECF subfamily)